MKYGLILAAACLLCAAGMGTGAEKQGATGPWDLKALQKAPRFEVVGTETVREGETEVVLSTLYYEGEPWMGRPTRVFAYYARPASLPARAPAAKRLPAMVLVHGGGGTAFPQWARLWAARGYAALAMDLAGKGPERQPLPDGGPDQTDEWKFRRLKDGVRNAWPYYAVAAVVRGVSLLGAMPEVDRKRIGITGISWGGYLTSIVMSLDGRLQAAVPVYGCGFLHENSVWVPTLASLPEEERRAWIENFDPSRYLARCRIPTLWVNGTNDFAYPLDSYQKSYRAVSGPRSLCVTVKMPHGHEAGWARPEIGAFVDSLLLKGPFPAAHPTVSAPAVKDGKVRVLFRGDGTISKAHLHWTTELAKPWAEREWKTAPARVLSLDEVEAELPKEGPLVFFVTVTDLRGMVASTEHAGG
jgi:dienelactone hydrolase